jgi:hypothetical protein
VSSTQRSPTSTADLIVRALVFLLGNAFVVSGTVEYCALRQPPPIRSKPRQTPHQGLGALVWAGLGVLGTGLLGFISFLQAPAAFEDIHKRMCSRSTMQGVAGWFGDCAEYTSKQPATLVVMAPDAPRTPPEIPVGQVFQVTPTFFGQTLTVSVEKLAAKWDGRLEVIACNNAIYNYVGDTAFSRGTDSFIFSTTYTQQQVVILLIVERKGEAPVSVMAPWRLDRMTRTSEPVERVGRLDCRHVHGYFK